MLRLLAAGHTVKSAAAITGNSENAVAELLRSARQKLNVASSREAARLLALAEQTQEVGDRIPGVSQPAANAQGPWRSRRRSNLIMAATLPAGAFVTAMLVSQFGADTPSASPPRVVRSSPGLDAVTNPGPFPLSVTFDRAMQPDSYSFATGPEARYPQCDGRVRAGADGRTFTMNCRAEAGRRYVVWANHGRFMNFRTVDGTPARPTRIAFSVSGR